MNAATLDQARAAKADAMAAFAPLADVVGIGITRLDDGYAVKVNLRNAPAPGVNLPKNVNGVPVQVEVVGTLRKR